MGNLLSNTKTGDSSRIRRNSSGVRRATRRVVWLVDAATSRRGHYGSEFNVARNWLNVGRPLDGPRPGAIGVKAHHVFQVVRVVDPRHVLAISGNDHNAVQTRIRPTSDVIGWRDVTEENTAVDQATAGATLHPPAGTTAIKSDQTATKHFAIRDPVGNCSVIDAQPSWASGMQLLSNKNGYSSMKNAQAALGSDCKGKIGRG